VNHFELRSGELWCEDVPLTRIAEVVGTPVYVYSTATLERHFTVFRNAFAAHRAILGDPLVAYAVKANGNVSVLRTLARLGAGADTVSEGEIRRALAAGVPADRIIFSGVGKTDAELAFALDAGVHQINVESAPELERLAAVAAARGAAAAVAPRRLRARRIAPESTSRSTQSTSCPTSGCRPSRASTTAPCARSTSACAAAALTDSATSSS